MNVNTSKPVIQVLEAAFTDAVSWSIETPVVKSPKGELSAMEWLENMKRRSPLVSSVPKSVCLWLVEEMNADPYLWIPRSDKPRKRGCVVVEYACFVIPLTATCVRYDRQIDVNKWELCYDRQDGMTSRRVRYLVTRRINGELMQIKQPGEKLSNVPTNLLHNVKPGAQWP